VLDEFPGSRIKIAAGRDDLDGQRLCEIGWKPSHRLLPAKMLAGSDSEAAIVKLRGIDILAQKCAGTRRTTTERCRLARQLSLRKSL
jgi:hypothetical protein